MNNQEQYYEVIEPLLAEWLVTEVYRSDNISVLNLADKSYLVSLISENA